MPGAAAGDHGRTASAAVRGASGPGRLGSARYPAVPGRLHKAVLGIGQPRRALIQVLRGGRQGNVLVQGAQAKVRKGGAVTGKGVYGLTEERDERREVVFGERPAR